MRIWINIKKVLIIFLSLFIVSFSLSAPYSTRNIDKLAYVIALGLDIGNSNTLKLSVQLAKPSNGSSGSSGRAYEKIVNSVECASIETGISLLNSYISRRLDLSHCKAIVISEKLAHKGVSEYMYTLLSSPRTSPHASIIISKIPSEDFLNIASPELEDLPSRFYEITLASNEYTSYTQNVTLINFFSDCVDSFKNPVATLGSSSSLPISPADNIENIGLAVFKNDILVGELNAEESILHMMVSNKLKSCTISIPNPIGDSESINLSIKLAHNTKNSVSLVNGTPFISSVVKINAKIESATQKSSYGNSSYYSNENIQLIEESCNQYLKKALNDYLYKTAKEYNCDIDGFGKYAVKYFPTIKDWQDYNWLDNFQNSTFNVSIETTIKSGNTFL